MAISRAHAEITSTGSVSPNPLFVTAQDDLTITGTLDITNGSVIASRDGDIFGSGSYVRVNGTGSEWMMFGDLSLFGSGGPHLLIEDGGVVSNIDAHIFGSSSAAGSVVVDGAGSTWNTAGDLFVGGSPNTTSNGYITIGDGATVNVGDGVHVGPLPDRVGFIDFDNGTLNTHWGLAQLDGLRGTGIINADHWLLSGSYTIASGVDLPNVMTLNDLPGQNITVNLGWVTPLNQLEVFGIDDGTMTLNSGFTVTSERGFVGYSEADTSSEMTVDGPGTQWTLVQVLEIGRLSDGTLNIINGGRVVFDDAGAPSDTSLGVGIENGGNGSILVEGAGSRLDLEGSILLGALSLNPDMGRGNLSILSGGVVNAGGIGLEQGALHVSGMESSLTLDSLFTYHFLDPDTGDFATAVFENGATVDTPLVVIQGGVGLPAGVLVTGAGTTWTATDRMLIGDRSRGSIRIEDGATVHARTAVIGFEHNSVDPSSVVVTGTGSHWLIDEDLYVGEHGNASLTIADGGHVEVGGVLRVNYANNSSDPTYLTLDNGALTAGQGSFLHGGNVLGVGTVNVNTWLLEGDHTVNSFAELPGQISVSHLPGQDLTVNIGWVPETLYDYQNFGVNNGHTTLGGSLDFDSHTGYVGFLSGSDGELTLTGAMTQWDTLNLFVGVGGTGDLVIEGGARVEISLSAVIGQETGAVGSVLVTGVGSHWQGSRPHIGKFGQGTFRIEAGATAGVGHIYLGEENGSSGELVVTGAGSAMSSSGTLYLGEFGSTASGVLRVLDGGQVNLRRIVAERSNAQHTVQVDGAGSTLTLIDAISAEERTGDWLSITNGGSIASEDEHRISGGLEIDGPGSQWLIDGDLFLGTKVYASLELTAGASLTTGNAAVGQNQSGQSNAQADVLVDGPGTLFTVNGNFELGGTTSDNVPIPGDYRGVLTISNGAAVTIDGALLVDPFQSGSHVQFDDGTLNLDSALILSDGLRGTGTANADYWLLSGDYVLSDFSALPSQIVYDQFPDQNVTVNLAWSDPSREFEFFGVDDGSVTLNSGLAIASNTGYLALSPGAAGELILEGTGTSWQVAEHLYTGFQGDGTVLVQAGADLQADRLHIGETAGSIGLLEVTGPGSTAMAGSLELGRYGTGTIRIAAGGVVTIDAAGSNHFASVGLFRESSGDIVVTDAGSRLDVLLDRLTLGDNGDGSLTITGGSEVNTNELRLSQRFTSTSAIVVDGGELNASRLRIGEFGEGSIQILNGAVVNSPRAWLAVDSKTNSGIQQRSRGTAWVDGVGTVWQINDGFAIGMEGDATLDITGGAHVNSSATWISSDDGGTGQATVNGVGSVWETSGNFVIFEQGELRVEAAGTVGIGDSLYHLEDALITIQFDAQPTQSITIGADAILEGSLAIVFTSDAAVVLGETTDLLTIEGTRTGEFSGAAEGQTLASHAGIDLLLTYVAGDGNDVAVVAALSGDVDGDQSVSATDLDILLANWGGAVAVFDRAAGDLSGDGIVGEADLQLVLANWGNNASNTGAVPEPASITLLGLGALAFTRRRRQGVES